MKKHLLPLMAFALLFVLETSFAQTVVTLRNTPANAYEQSVSSDFPTYTGGSFAPTSAITGQAWTAGGTPGGWRTFFRYNDSAISNMLIDSAFLQLYADITSGFGYSGEPNYGTDNVCGIYRVTSAWNDTTVCWNTMPTYTSVDSVVLPQSTSYTENYLHIDVTNMLRGDSTNNYGFMIKSLQEITPYNSMIFYSTSSAPDSSVRPQIVVYGRIPSAVSNIQKEPGAINIFPNPAAGMLSVTTTGIISHIAIVNLLGETLYSQQCNAPNAQVNIANLSPGIYLVKINDCYVRKFIKE